MKKITIWFSHQKRIFYYHNFLGKVIETQKNQKIISGFTVMNDLKNGNILISIVQIKELRNRP